MRCILFEFKVGRPRYKDSIVEGDVRAFQADVRRKIEHGLDQEIDFYKQVQTGQRDLSAIVTGDAVQVVLRDRCDGSFPCNGCPPGTAPREIGEGGGYRRMPDDTDRLYLSLSELEQLETLPKNRVSQLLIEWDDGPDRHWPFNTFYAHRTRSQPVGNSRIAELAEEEMD